jgi:hypothetical protein
VAYFGHDDVLEFLLEEFKILNLPVDTLDKTGYTPLLYGKLKLKFSPFTLMTITLVPK